MGSYMEYDKKVVLLIGNISYEKKEGRQRCVSILTAKRF